MHEIVGNLVEQLLKESEIVDGKRMYKASTVEKLNRLGVSLTLSDKGIFN